MQMVNFEVKSILVFLFFNQLLGDDANPSHVSLHYLSLQPVRFLSLSLFLALFRADRTLLLWHQAADSACICRKSQPKHSKEMRYILNFSTAGTLILI